MGTLSFRLDDELKKAIQGRAKLENKTTSEFILDTLKEKLEDEEDLQMALLAYESVDMEDKTTLEDLCKEAGIDYGTL